MTAPVKDAADEYRCSLFLSFVLISRLSSHGAKSDVTYIFLSLTATYYCLKSLKPLCVCINNESPHKCYKDMKKGVELLGFIYVFFENWIASLRYLLKL